MKSRIAKTCKQLTLDGVMLDEVKCCDYVPHGSLDIYKKTTTKLVSLKVNRYIIGKNTTGSNILTKVNLKDDISSYFPSVKILLTTTEVLPY